ncbi:hypothetical protein PTKIN_Ptkin19aG0134700 [Pterospermum kingtungense]
MAPRKRKASDGDGAQATPQPQAQDTFKRVTRSMTTQPDGRSSGSNLPKKEKPKAKGKAKASTKEKKEEDAVAVAVEEGAKAKAATEEGPQGKTVIVEHCKQCNSFKTRAFQVRDGLQKGVVGITVLLNPEKPRRGCFEIREEGGETFISLLVILVLAVFKNN